MTQTSNVGGLEISVDEAFSLLSTNLENHADCLDYASCHSSIYSEIQRTFFCDDELDMKNAWVNYQTTKYGVA